MVGQRLIPEEVPLKKQQQHFFRSDRGSQVQHCTQIVLWAEAANIFEDYRTKMYRDGLSKSFETDFTLVSTMFIKPKN